MAIASLLKDRMNATMESGKSTTVKILPKIPRNCKGGMTFGPVNRGDGAGGGDDAGDAR
jgi:hypothetical protein